MSKVHCEDCEFYKGALPETEAPQCIHHNNSGTWLSKNELNNHPWNINKNMDCKWHKTKIQLYTPQTAKREKQ